MIGNNHHHFMQLTCLKSETLICLTLKFCFSKLVFLYFYKFKVRSSQLTLITMDNVFHCILQDFQNNMSVESVIKIDINLDTHKKEKEKDGHLYFKKLLSFIYSCLHFYIFHLISLTSEKK